MKFISEGKTEFKTTVSKMKITLLLLSICYFTFTLADPLPPYVCRPDFSYYGYWGADLFNIQLLPYPTVIWDSEDPAQLQQAVNTGVRVLFYLQNLILDFNTTGQMYSFKSGWKDIFDQNYGNITNPTNPYNVTGIIATGTNGFFMGSQLVWFGLSHGDLESYSSHIRAKYPAALIGYDEDYRSLRYHHDFHNKYYGNIVPTEIDFISISHYWPDVITGQILEDDMRWIFQTQIQPYIASYQFIIWSTPAYSTNETFENSTCHPKPGQHCINRMSDAMVSAIDFQCDIEICATKNPVSGYYYAAQVKGIWVWHWDSRPDLPGYEIGVKDLSLDDLYDQTLSNTYSCVNYVSSASHITLTSFIGLTFIVLLI